MYERSKDPKFISWSKKVKQRDDFQCQICFKDNQYLESHHCYNWQDFPEKRFDINNGVTLCKQHHEQFHNIFGKSFNTLEQFKQFKQICKLFKKIALETSSRVNDGYIGGNA